MPKADWGGSLGGAASGAMTGAALGSIIPGIGTAVGSAAGGLFGGINSLFGKKKKKSKKKGTLDPQQQQLYDDYVSSIRGQGPMSDLYNFDAQGYNNVFDQTVGRPAYRNFQENVIPGITGQFRGNNLMGSSYAGQALSRAGRDVQENLDALRAQNVFQGQQAAQSNKMNAIPNVLNMQTFATQRPQAQAPGPVDQVLGSLAPAAGDWFNDYLQRMGG